MSISLHHLFLIVVNTFLLSSVTSEILEYNNGAVLNSEFSTLSRRPRETIVGHGCPKGRIWYYGKCKLLKELRDSDYFDFNDTNKHEKLTLKTTTEKFKMESKESDLNLAVIPISKAETSTQTDAEIIPLNPNITEIKSESTEKPKLLETTEGSTIIEQVSQVITNPTTDSSTEAIEEILNVTESNSVINITSKDISNEVSSVNEEKKLEMETDSPTTEPGFSVTQETYLVTDPTYILPKSSHATVDPIWTSDVTTTETTDVYTFEISTTEKPTTSEITLTELTATETYSTITPDPPPSFLVTKATNTEEDLWDTTIVQNKDHPEDIGLNDKISDILLEVKSIIFTLLFVVSGAFILCWTFETLFMIILRRQDGNYKNIPVLLKLQNLPLTKEQDSMV